MIIRPSGPLWPTLLVRNPRHRLQRRAQRRQLTCRVAGAEVDMILTKLSHHTGVDGIWVSDEGDKKEVALIPITVEQDSPAPPPRSGRFSRSCSHG